MVVAPLTVPLPVSVWEAPTVQPLTALTSRAAPLQTLMVEPVAMEPVEPMASVPRVMVVAPV